jgi:hypothetical protein
MVDNDVYILYVKKIVDIWNNHYLGSIRQESTLIIPTNGCHFQLLYHLCAPAFKEKNHTFKNERQDVHTELKGGNMRNLEIT